MPSKITAFLLNDKSELTDIQEVSSARWSTRIGPQTKRPYENAIHQAFSKKDSVSEYVLVGRWSDNVDWDVRLRIPFGEVVRVDAENSLIAFEEEAGVVSVTNGFQSIHDIERSIPLNKPRVLREFAGQVLQELA